MSLVELQICTQLFLCATSFYECNLYLPLLGHAPRQASVFVRFFGDHTVCCLPAVAAGQRLPDRGGVLAFLAALEAGWHVRRTRGEASSGAQARRFAQAMCELRTYLQVRMPNHEFHIGT